MALASLKASSDTVCAITFGCFCHCPSHFTVEVSDLPVSAEPLLPAPCVLLMTQKAAVRVPMGLQSLCSRRRTAGSQWKAQPCPSTGGERTQWKLTSRPCGYRRKLFLEHFLFLHAAASAPVLLLYGCLPAPQMSGFFRTRGQASPPSCAPSLLTGPLTTMSRFCVQPRDFLSSSPVYLYPDVSGILN